MYSTLLLSLLYSPFLYTTPLYSTLLSITPQRQMNVKTLQAGAELGLYTTLGFAFQSIGLDTTTASRSAFLLYLNVKFVPFFALLFLGRSITASTWISALLALSGTALLSTDGSPLNTGDVWCIAAAVASAMFILRLEKFSRENDAKELSGVSLLVTTVICALWMGVDYSHLDAHSIAMSFIQDSSLSSTVTQFAKVCNEISHVFDDITNPTSLSTFNC